MLKEYARTYIIYLVVYENLQKCGMFLTSKSLKFGPYSTSITSKPKDFGFEAKEVI